MNTTVDRRFDRSVSGFLRHAAHVSLRDPGLAVFFARETLRQRTAASRRHAWAKEGILVPPLMIVSVTRQCNLRCAGCFVHAQGKRDAQQMTLLELDSLFFQARDMGVSIVALAGGEPLTRPEILDVAAEYPEIMFMLITNGSLLRAEHLEKLQRSRHIIPVVSIEGYETQTNGRRGAGVYELAVSAMERMRERRLFFGVSIMVTRRNFPETTSRAFVRRLIGLGSRLFFYVDYVPIEPGTEYLIPSASQRRSEALTMTVLRGEFPGLFLASSASEEAFGGCMAAGRGFVHVNAEGALEPCPFAPYSDVNLRSTTLREALGSNLLREIRESGEHLSESGGGCALWANREWVQALAGAGSESEKTPAYSVTLAA
jgi:MoaA/NifB/PqqE/SkfB family radical SAM enzyme